MLQTNTVKKSTFELLKQLQGEPLLSRTRLVGGTALSLQIGHRIGYTFDFEKVKRRIIKMTDNPDKVYAMAPLKRQK